MWRDWVTRIHSSERRCGIYTQLVCLSTVTEWRTASYRRAYTAPEDEFTLAAAMIKARANAGLTQEQLARRMQTTQAVIARLESRRVKRSTRTLERLATATGAKLRISFEADNCTT